MTSFGGPDLASWDHYTTESSHDKNLIWLILHSLCAKLYIKDIHAIKNKQMNKCFTEKLQMLMENQLEEIKALREKIASPPSPWSCSPGWQQLVCAAQNYCWASWWVKGQGQCALGGPTGRTHTAAVCSVWRPSPGVAAGRTQARNTLTRRASPVPRPGTSLLYPAQPRPARPWTSRVPRPAPPPPRRKRASRASHLPRPPGPRRAPRWWRRSAGPWCHWGSHRTTTCRSVRHSQPWGTATWQGRPGGAATSWTTFWQLPSTNKQTTFCQLGNVLVAAGGHTFTIIKKYTEAGNKSVWLPCNFL